MLSVEAINLDRVLRRAAGEIGEVAVPLPPSADGTNDPTHQLLDRGFATRIAEGASEVLRSHDLGGGLTPSRRHLYVWLREHDLAFGVGDGSRATGEAHPLEELIADAEAARYPEPPRLGLCGPWARLWGPVSGLFELHAY